MIEENHQYNIDTPYRMRLLTCFKKYLAGFCWSGMLFIDFIYEGVLFALR